MLVKSILRVRKIIPIIDGFVKDFLLDLPANRPIHSVAVAERTSPHTLLPALKFLLETLSGRVFWHNMLYLCPIGSQYIVVWPILFFVNISTYRFVDPSCFFCPKKSTSLLGDMSSSRLVDLSFYWPTTRGYSREKVFHSFADSPGIRVTGR